MGAVLGIQHSRAHAHNVVAGDEDSPVSLPQRHVPLGVSGRLDHLEVQVCPQVTHQGLCVCVWTGIIVPSVEMSTWRS